MSFSTYDRYDAEWENPDTGRTVFKSSDDEDGYCEHCDSTDCACCTCTYGAYVKYAGGTGFDVVKYDPACPEHFPR